MSCITIVVGVRVLIAVIKGARIAVAIPGCVRIAIKVTSSIDRHYSIAITAALHVIASVDFDIFHHLSAPLSTSDR